MSAAVQVSSFRFPVSSDEAQGLTPEQVSSFRFPVASEEPQGLKPTESVTAFAARLPRLRSGQVPLCPSPGAMELPQVVAASRLADRPAAAMVLSGIEELDALTGGLPRGGLTEMRAGVVGTNQRAHGGDGEDDGAGRSVRAGGRQRQLRSEVGGSGGSGVEEIALGAVLTTETRRHGEKHCRLSIVDCRLPKKWSVVSGQWGAKGNSVDGPFGPLRAG